MGVLKGVGVGGMGVLKGFILNGLLHWGKVVVRWSWGCERR
jgi:hypothetical protein